MKLHVAHDGQGRIIAASEIGPKGAGDRPSGRSDLKVVEVEIPEEFHGKSLHEFLHQVQVDVNGRKLVRKR